MDPRIVKARQHLDKAEKTNDPINKKLICQTAMKIIDEVIEDEPEEIDMITVSRIRKSFARSLVTQVGDMNLNNIETTRFFLFDFVLKYPTEILELQNESSEFKQKFEWLADQFRSDFA